MAAFKKLDDLPKGRPYTQDEVMKAMSELHKLVLKQSAAYGGKNSKYLPAQVVEGSLLKTFEAQEKSCDDEVGRLLDVAHKHAEELNDHLKSKDDKIALKHLGQLLRMLGAAMSTAK